MLPVRLKGRGLMLAAIMLTFMLPLAGCANPTRSQMMNDAIFANKTFTKVERSLNQAFAAGIMAPEKHSELDPSIKAARAAVDKLTQDALDPNFKPSQWRVAYDIFLAAAEPLLTATLNTPTASVRALTPTSRASPPR